MFSNGAKKNIPVVTGIQSILHIFTLIYNKKKSLQKVRQCGGEQLGEGFLPVKNPL